MTKHYSLYYVAKTDRSRGWFLASTVRGTEHLCFDRCLDKEKAIFEFFVPEKMEEPFLDLMNYLKKEAVVFSLEKKENRLIYEDLV
ncbi:hypothetical protein K9K77_01580 [Candidatus Babeliales bacterium]|nr:hypothetical protein [Candidatus Babeliales bacterium]